MRKHRASVSTIALVTTIIMLIIAVSLINMAQFSLINTARDAEVERGYWFLEGLVEEYFDNIIEGKSPLRTGSFSGEDFIDGKKQTYTFDVRTLESQNYALHAHMKWKERYRIEQYIEFSRFNLFDYVLVFNQDKTIRLNQNMLVVGDIAARGNLNITPVSTGNSFYYYTSDSYMPKIHYSETKPAVSPIFFYHDFRDLVTAPYISYNYDIKKRSIEQLLLYDKSLEQMEVPDFNTVWASLYPYRDVAWVIEDSTFFDTQIVVNTHSSWKQLVAYGNGFSTRFDLNVPKINNLYIKRISSHRKYQQINSLGYAYYRGSLNSRNFFEYDGKTLYLRASSEPVPLLLPDDAYQKFGQISFSGDQWSYISFDERVEKLYIDSLKAGNQLYLGVDCDYYPAQKNIRITAKRFYENYTRILGTGDGFRINFPNPVTGGRVYYYVGGIRTQELLSLGSQIVFNTPPGWGKQIAVMTEPPMFYLQKMPPNDNTGIFVDIAEECVVLNLSDIQNYPNNGVIIATVPLLIKGTSREPLAIISTENIYIININPELKGQPVMIASGKGVWLYRPSTAEKLRLNKVVIYSPLNDLLTINETGEYDNPPVVIYGSVIFTGENSSAVMNLDMFEKTFIYYREIKNYLNSPPFSLFPLPIRIESIKRS